LRRLLHPRRPPLRERHDLGGGVHRRLVRTRALEEAYRSLLSLFLRGEELVIAGWNRELGPISATTD
jgi:hypothetical protein